jgi:hypothetical protein
MSARHEFKVSHSLSNTCASPQPDRGSFLFGAPTARIFQPAASPMQAARRHRWVLEFEPAKPRWIEPLMGWTASEDPFACIRLSFPSLAAAVEYAERMGLEYRVHEPGARRGQRFRNTVPSRTAAPHKPQVRVA